MLNSIAGHAPVITLQRVVLTVGCRDLAINLVVLQVNLDELYQLAWVERRQGTCQVVALQVNLHQHAGAGQTRQGTV